MNKKMSRECGDGCEADAFMNARAELLLFHQFSTISQTVISPWCCWAFIPVYDIMSVSEEKIQPLCGSRQISAPARLLGSLHAGIKEHAYVIYHLCQNEK